MLPEQSNNTQSKDIKITLLANYLYLSSSLTTLGFTQKLIITVVHLVSTEKATCSTNEQNDTNGLLNKWEVKGINAQDRLAFSHNHMKATDSSSQTTDTHHCIHESRCALRLLILLGVYVCGHDHKLCKLFLNIRDVF